MQTLPLNTYPTHKLNDSVTWAKSKKKENYKKYTYDVCILWLESNAIVLQSTQNVFSNE